MYKLALFIILLSFLSVAFFSPEPAMATPITVLPEEEPADVRLDPTPVLSFEALPRTKLPETPVQMYIMRGHDSRFKLFFIDITYGYDLVDFEYYGAWCLQKNKKIRRNSMHQVTLHDCYDPNVPPQFRNVDWNRINYIINHKQGPKYAIQEAIWHFSGTGSKHLSEEAVELIDEANEKGTDYKPGAGELLAIICQPESGQAVFIEYLIPKSEPFEVAPAFYAPMAAPVVAAPSYLGFLALAPLLAIPAFIPPDSPPPEYPPPPPPSVPEPSSLALLASALAAFAVFKRK